VQTGGLMDGHVDVAVTRRNLLPRMAIRLARRIIVMLWKFTLCIIAIGVVRAPNELTI
jgi:hypothetical protein